MEEIHRQAIRRNFSSLVYQTDFDVMREALTEKGLFTQHMIEHYADSPSPSIEKKRSMYNAIMRRGPQAFDILLETLEENGYWDLVRMLDPNSTLNAVSNAVPSEQIKDNRDYISLTTTRIIPQNKTNNDPEPLDNDEPVPAPHTPQNHETPFKVIKSTKFIEDNEINDIKLYRTRSKNRGVCILITYILFQNDLEKQREGAEKDNNNLKYLFREIGFRVFAFEDLTYQETVELLDGLKHKIDPKEECVFVVVSSHGYERSGSTDTDIRCHDGRLISLQEIISYFSNKQLPRLRDVPKVFIFQNCRGKNEDYILDNDTAPPPLTLPAVETDGAPIPSSPSSHQSVKGTAWYTNILVVQSTLPGFVSYRDTSKGSWYIQVLCEKFAERAHDTHVDDLFTMVDQLLKQRYHIQTSSVDRWGFNKRLYLHPGLFE